MGVRLLLATVVLVTLALAAGSRSPAAADPVAFHCTLDAACPAITVNGDPFAEIGGSPAPFRGYGDPSLEYDPDTGTLWLTYSWLDVLINDPGPPPVVDFGVRTHLASSTDGGLTWTFETAINATQPIQHPDTSEDGWTIHEVSSLLRAGPGDWQSVWLTYFDPEGEPPGPEDRKDFYLQRSLASSPPGLDASPAPWVRGYGTSPSFGATYDLSAMPQLADCFTFTEPALFAHDGATYLALNCVVIDAGVRQFEDERLLLLREEAAGYAYVGDLLTFDDAQQFGGTTIEQVDLSYARDGGIMLLATPIDNDATPPHLGCVALEVTDIASAQVRRDTAGDAVPLALITGDDEVIGPGACTYDAASQTGVLMHVHDFTLSPFDMEFTVRATGLHPDTSAATLDPDSDGFITSDELYFGTDPNIACGFTPGGGPASETWPADLAESNNINIGDVLALKPVFGAPSPPARYDLVPGAGVNIGDVLRLKPVFGASCFP